MVNWVKFCYSKKRLKFMTYKYYAPKQFLGLRRNYFFYILILHQVKLNLNSLLKYEACCSFFVTFVGMKMEQMLKVSSNIFLAESHVLFSIFRFNNDLLKFQVWHRLPKKILLFYSSYGSLKYIIFEMCVKIP